ncbi:MAG TPA: SDR family oxidoreductase [Acidimicrobiales bacterium]|jgi:NAD(P)-dependent dehydrogenase (short-subunit alcohol dehydrogenase family)|nr:SDR family oxidoreductase [Acidimicrobiales bacterium]
MNVASFDVEASGELAGKVAIVTGGASGIGRATVERFVEAGARVVIADIDDDAARALAAQLGDAVDFRRTDVGDRVSLQEVVDFTVERFGGLHVMFNNAGVASSMTRFLHDDLEDFARVMQINVLGAMLGCQFAARHMKDNGGGSIINCASIAGIQAGSGLLPYRASKAAVIHATKSIAVDVAQYGIRVNCIAPGQIQTGMTTYDMDAVIRFTQPLQRRGSATDVADTVVYLASDRSAQITGVLIPIDGGTTAGAPPAQAKLMLQAGTKPA